MKTHVHIFTPLLLIGLFLIPASISVRGAETRWIPTNSWSAGGDTTTRVFDVFGDAWQVHYANRDTRRLAIRVLNEAGEVVGKPIEADRPIRGVHTFSGPGRFYLQAAGPSGRWEISVRQELTRLQEWDLRQKNATLDDRLEKVASFTGESDMAEYPILIAAGGWKFSYQNGSGEMSLRVVDTVSGEVVFQRLLTRPEKAESWVHRPGRFRIEVESVQSAWRIDVFSRGAKAGSAVVAVDPVPVEID